MPVVGLMLSRLVLSMSYRSTCGVNMMPGGKCPLIPTGATNPAHTASSRRWDRVRPGLESTSRWVIVVWLISWIVRDVSGAWSLPK